MHIPVSNCIKMLRIMCICFFSERLLENKVAIMTNMDWISEHCELGYETKVAIINTSIIIHLFLACCLTWAP